jgi:hypothetical protein
MPAEDCDARGFETHKIRARASCSVSGQAILISSAISQDIFVSTHAPLRLTLIVLAISRVTSVPAPHKA